MKADSQAAAESIMKEGTIRELGNKKGWFVDVNFSRTDCVEIAMDLLEMCDMPRETLVLNEILTEALRRQ